MVTWVQVLDEADYISYHADILLKGTHPTIFLLDMNQKVGHTVQLNFSKVISLGEGNIWIQTY